MATQEGIPGTLSPAAKAIRWTGMNGGTEAGRRYLAVVPDGRLVAIVSRDADEDGKPLWHLSISHRDNNDIPDRCPNWDEMKSAKYQLVPDDVPMVLIFPRRAVPYVNVYGTCLHLWEAEQGIDE